MPAERLHAFGMKRIGYDKFPIQGLDCLDRKLCAGDGDSLAPLLGQSDFVILTLSLTDETFHMINRERLAKMKPGACPVNMARGGIVCTEDLVEALNSGHLGGAGPTRKKQKGAGIPDAHGIGIPAPFGFGGASEI